VDKVLISKAHAAVVQAAANITAQQSGFRNRRIVDERRAEHVRKLPGVGFRDNDSATEGSASWRRSTALRINDREVNLVAPVQRQMAVWLGAVLKQCNPVKE
jgi:hypothetical protein